MEMKDKKVKGYDKWELESCVDTLIRAEEIKADSEKMAALKPMLAKRIKALEGISDIASIDDLKRVREEKNKSEEYDEEDDTKEQSED